MQQVEPRQALEQFPKDMWSAADAVRSDGYLGRIVPSVGNEFMNRTRGERRKHNQNAHSLCEAGNGGDVAGITEIEVVIDGRVPTVVGASKEQRISVRCRSRHRLGRNTAAGTRSVLNNEWLM